jgi:hypothetical protein
MIGEAQPASTVQHRWRRIGWLLYLVGYCLMAGDYPGVGLAVFALGMLCHWRFWRWALPLGLIAFCFGYWRGTRKAAERRRTPLCRSS